MNNQPSYQVPWSRLAEARTTLQALGMGEYWQERSVLFLCGLKFNFTYFQASMSETAPRTRHCGAGHLVDDGLDEASRSAMKVLMKVAKSRKHRESFSGIDLGPINREWFYLRMAMTGLDSELPVRVQAWLKTGIEEVNWTRLAFGMGVCSLWNANAYAASILRGPFHFVNGSNQFVTDEIRQLLDNFSWDPTWVVPEI